MDMNLNMFKNDISRQPELLEKLRKRVLLKTEVDVVYSDLTNWERYGLLFIDSDAGKRKWKRLNYIEYVWVKLVEQLRGFGFAYDDIKYIKRKLMAPVSAEQYMELQKMQTTRMSLTPANYPGRLLEFYISRAISMNRVTALLFDKDKPGDFVLFPEEISTKAGKQDPMKVLLHYFRRSFVSISLSDIISRFLSESDSENEQSKLPIVSKDEHRLMTVLRNDHKSIESIRVKLGNERTDRIEVKRYKKVALESHIMCHIKKGNYREIGYSTLDGNEVRFENKRRGCDLF